MSETKENSSSAGKKPGFVLGLLSLIFGIIGAASPVIGVIGLILGIIGLAAKNRKVLCILGIAISVITIAVSSGSGNNSGTIENSTAEEPAALTQTAGAEETVPESTVTDNRNSAVAATQQLSPASEVTADDFDVKEYSYENIIGDTLYFLVIKNNSDLTVDIHGNGTAMDAEDNTLGAAECSLDVLGPGEESLACFYFDGVSDVDHVDYTLDWEEEHYYSPVISEISLQESVNEGNLTVTATNSGDVPASFVEAYALFMDADDNVVSYSSGYITDSQMAIQPGATLSVQLDAYDSFDHVECYITGRGDSLMDTIGENAAGDEVSADQFTVEEYPWNDSLSSYEYLVITNNSEETVSIFGNGTALSADGAVLGASDCTVNVLGPGEKTITCFYFSEVQGVDHVEYQLSYRKEEDWQPVISSLSTKVSVNDENVVVAVTNNGKDAAEFVEVHALFFDASNNVIYANETYAMDDDSEIKPGATQTVQLNAYQTFDHAEVFLTGRAD